MYSPDVFIYFYWFNAARTGEHEMNPPSFQNLRFTFRRLVFIPSKLFNWIELNFLNKLEFDFSQLGRKVFKNERPYVQIFEG